MTKIVAVIFLLVSMMPAGQAQLIFVGEDAVTNNADGYAGNYKTVAAVEHDGAYYFISPNGYLYQAGRTENTLKIIEKFAPQNNMFFEATKKYIYYSSSSEGDGYRTVTQFNPATQKINYYLQCPAPNEKLSVNGLQVPGYDYTVSQMFTGSDKDKLFIRSFKNDMLSVYAIHDDNPTKVHAVYSGGIPSSKSTTMNISVNSTVVDRGKDVFVNGRSKPASSYETTSTVVRMDNATSNYSFLTMYLLKDKGYTLYDGFLRTDSAIYTLAKLEKDGKTDYSLFRYNEKMIYGVPVSFSPMQDGYAAQEINRSIYISNNNEVARYNEATQQLGKKFRYASPGSSWGDIQFRKRFLKAGNYLLCKVGKDFQVLNEASAVWKKMKTAGLANEPNRFRLTQNYAYAGRQHFFFVDTQNGGEQFTSYNPVSDDYTVINFPVFKKETFSSIKGLLQHADGFIILTAYTDKKGKPVYRIFNYIEEITTTTAISPGVTGTAKNQPTPVKVTKEKSPHKIADKTSRIVFEESFKNNKNNWVLDKTIPRDSATLEIKSGALLFDNKQDKVTFTGITIPDKVGIKLATDEEWTFKATVKHISGATNGTLGVHFGQVINGSMNEGLIFATDADRNSYSILEKRGLNYYTVKAWTIDAAVKKSGNANELQVVKSPGRLSFFINGKFVFQTANKYPPSGIGFILQNKQTVQFDDISITSIATVAAKTEKDRVNDLLAIFKASDSNFRKHYLPSSDFKKQSWLPVIDNGANQFYLYEGVPLPFEKTGVRYAPYYENNSSVNDIKMLQAKTVQLSKIIEAALGTYTKTEVTKTLGTTWYWQSNNPALANGLTVALENFELSGLYFTRIVVLQASGIKLPEVNE